MKDLEIYTRNDKYFVVCSKNISNELSILCTGNYITGLIDNIWTKETGDLLERRMERVGLTKCDNEATSAKILLIS